MDSYGVTHAVIQPVPGNTSLELVANVAKKHKGGGPAPGRDSRSRGGTHGRT
jgi:hypothetical protein